MDRDSALAIDPAAFDALTFDCYGTLIDWEAGLVAGFREAFGAAADDLDPEDLLVRFARYEASSEAGPYRRYREILAAGVRGLGDELGLPVSDPAAERFGGSVVDWPAFPDSAEALDRLQRRYRLGILTNCDDDLFAASNRRLGVDFDWVVTAQQVGSYKPSPANFEAMFERLGTDGVERGRILHVAQSLFHDHAPAKALGMTTVWIDRRHDRPGAGATPRAEASPDARFPSMAAFAEAIVPD